MNQRTATLPNETVEGEPTWDIAYLFPLQGSWSEDEYLALDGNYLVEFDNGFLEILPMPTLPHQRLAFYLCQLLLAFATAKDLGEAVIAPYRVRLWPGKFREPDVVFMRKEHADRMGDDYSEGADLVMEVVSGSPQDRERDLVKKRADYAKAGIPEYWIIDPQEEQITVLRLARKRYVVHGQFGKGTVASSRLLPGFTVDVSTTLAQQRRPSAKESGRPT